MVALRGDVRLRRFLRQWRRLWAAALCAASFATGQMLFGDDAPPLPAETPSLLSQYRQATSQMVEESAGSHESTTESQQPDVRHQKSERRSPKLEFEGQSLQPAKSAATTDRQIPNPKSATQNPKSQMSHLRPTAVQPAKGVSLVEAKPLRSEERRVG